MPERPNERPAKLQLVNLFGLVNCVAKLHRRLKMVQKIYIYGMTNGTTVYCVVSTIPYD